MGRVLLQADPRRVRELPEEYVVYCGAWLDGVQGNGFIKGRLFDKHRLLFPSGVSSIVTLSSWVGKEEKCSESIEGLIAQIPGKFFCFILCVRDLFCECPVTVSYPSLTFNQSCASLLPVLYSNSTLT